MSKALPSDWSDLEALIGQPESSQLDFKERLIDNSKIAKAVAAMSVAGGAVIFGVAQDEQTGLASVLCPVPDVARAEERISKVITGSIDPPPKFSLWVIRDPADPTRGVIVVRVPRSESGGHSVGGRFPVRHGTTTGWMNQSEIAAIFSGREQERPQPADLFQDAAQLPEIDEVRVRSVYEGCGQLRVAAQPRDSALEHPSSPWLEEPLGIAARTARKYAEERLAIYSPTLLLPKLEAWRPDGTRGWVAGRAGQGPETLIRQPSVAAVLAYPWRVLVQLTIPTVVLAHRDAPAYLCAYEGRIASELWGALAFFGELYAPAGGAQIDIATQLAGFRGAVSYHASRAMEGLRVDHLPQASHGDLRLVSTDADTLRTSPERIARELIERWLVPFYEGGDLLDYVTVPQQSGTRLPH